MTAYWLLKSEPEAFSWQKLCKEGRTPWDGVRNHQAARNLRQMHLGDLAFFYHSVKERQIVGKVKIVQTAYPDPTDTTGRFVAVDVVPVGPMARPVTLAQMRLAPALADLSLLRQSRLSVVPLTAQHWAFINAMSDGSLS